MFKFIARSPVIHLYDYFKTGKGFSDSWIGVLRCLCGCDASKNLVLAKVGVEFRFGQKTPMPDMSTFCPKKKRKIDTFGRLVRIWFVFGSPKYLVFYAFRRTNELGQAPSTCNRVSSTCSTSLLLCQTSKWLDKIARPINVQ